MVLPNCYDALKSSVWDDIVWLKQDVEETLEKAEISENVKEIVINNLFPNGQIRKAHTRARGESHRS